MKDIEVELKFPLKSPEKLIENLNKIAKKQEENYQKDIYYIPSHRDFLKQNPIKEWLRIRVTKKGTKINYKNWHHNTESRAVSCDEFETGFEDSEILRKIFQNLDFKEIVIVEKIRKTWNFKDTEIAVDNIGELGDFIEIEYKGEIKEIDEIKEYLYKILKEIAAEVGEQIFKGYPHLLLEKEGYFG